MSETAAAQPGPEPPQDVGALVRQDIAAVAAAREDIRRGIESILEAVRAHGDSAEAVMWLHRLADLGGDLRDRTAALREASLNELVASVGGTAPLALASEPEPEPAPRRHKHRAGRGQRPLYPHSVPAWMPVPLAAAWQVARHPAQHAVAASVMAGTAATLVIGGGAAVHVATAHPGGTGATSNPPASVVSATPISMPVPSSPSRIASAATKPRTDSALTFPVSPLPPVSSPVQGPGGGQAPAPLPSSLPVPQVSLVVTSSLDLGTGGSGVIRLAAFGGPVSWSASSSAGGLNLDSSSGTLAAGHSVAITVSIVADLQALAGPAQVTITYGDGRTVVVPVSWTLVPLPLPDPVPSDVASVLPSIGT